MKYLFIIILAVTSFGNDYDWKFQMREMMDNAEFNRNDIGGIALCINDSSLWELKAIKPNKWAVRYLDSSYPCTTLSGAELINTGTCLINTEGKNIHFYFPEHSSSNLQSPPSIITIRMGRIINDIYKSSTLARMPLVPISGMSGGKPIDAVAMVTNNNVNVFRAYMTLFTVPCGFYKFHCIVPITK